MLTRDKTHEDANKDRVLAINTVIKQHLSAGDAIKPGSVCLAKIHGSRDEDKITHTPENKTPSMTNPHVSASDMACALTSSWAEGGGEKGCSYLHNKLTSGF
jgi:hypothetical protein